MCATKSALTFSGSLQQRIVGPFERGAHHAVTDLDRIDGAARHRAVRRERIRRVERERPVRAEQVGRAHPAQLPRGAARTAGSWRACARSSSRCRAASSTSQKARPFLSSSTRPAVSGSCHLPSEMKWRGGSVLVGRQVRRHRLRVAVDEVEDAVAARVEAGDERGPGHRALRRDRGAERGEAASCGDLREMRHPAPGHQVARQVEIQPVEPEHDRSAGRWPVVPAAAPGRADEQPRRTRRPPADRMRAGVSCQASQRPPVHVGGRLDAEQPKRRGRDVDERRVRRLDRTGCRRRRPAPGADRCSGRRSTPWCCRRTRDPPRCRSRRPTTRGSRRCSQSAGPARCPRTDRHRASAVSNASRMAIASFSASRSPLSFAMISAFSAAASAPGSTMPCASRPFRLRNMPVRPTE